MTRIEQIAEPKERVKYLGPCDCGGTVVGQYGYGQLWSWCLRCTPVVTVKWPLTQRDSA